MAKLLIILVLVAVVIVGVGYIDKLITDWEGFGDAAQEAWSKAEVDEQTAILEMNDYQRKMEEAKGLLSIAGEKGQQYNLKDSRVDTILKKHRVTIRNSANKFIFPRNK